MAVGLADNRGTAANSPYPSRVGGRVRTPPIHDVVPRRAAVPKSVLAIVAVGGALGSLARWAVHETLPTPRTGVPWATLVENVTGAFLLGLLVVLTLGAHPRSRHLRPFLGAGVLGGYTTMSTYAAEVRGLLSDGRVSIALGYLLGTVVTVLVAVWLGTVSGRWVTASISRRDAASEGSA
jgi:CrcB protein